MPDVRPPRHFAGSQDRARDGSLTEAMTQRFIDLALYARGAGCSGILFTCSAFGPAIEAAGRASGVPTLKPNEAMFEQALALAQFSMAAALPAVQRQLKCPVLSSPDCAVLALKQRMAHA